MSESSTQKSFLFPTIADLKSAQKTGRQGTIACVLIAVMTLVLAGVTHSMQGVEPSSSVIGVTPIAAMIALVIYGLLAVMIYRMSRIAAAIALLLQAINFILVLVQQGFSGQLGIGILFLLAFINSVRGTFAYHRLRQQRQEAIQEVDAVP
jgi:hypothetical protein